MTRSLLITQSLLVICYDIILKGSSPSLFNDFTHALHLEFDMKDLGHLHYFLNIQVTFITNGLILVFYYCQNMLYISLIGALLHTVAKYNLNTNRNMCCNLIRRKREKVSEQREKISISEIQIAFQLYLHDCK